MNLHLILWELLFAIIVIINLIKNNKMDLLRETENGCVKIKHHSTSSTIEIIINSKQEKSQGGEMEEIKQSVYLDYNEFEDLTAAVNKMINK